MSLQDAFDQVFGPDNYLKLTMSPDEIAEQVNMWGTPIADINEDEFCPECEREVPRHYDSCPTREI